MGREALSKRPNWQRGTAVGGSGREETAKVILEVHIMPMPQYKFHRRPRHLAKVYGGKWGTIPDFAIENVDTSKIAFFEAKRQGKAGNAHERACKYFAPGLQLVGSQIAHYTNPFFFIFMNGLATDPKKRAEIIEWFDAPGYRDRYILWAPRTPADLISWFDNTVRRYIDADP